MAASAGADPYFSMSAWPVVPTAKRISWASAVSLAASSPVVGTTR